MVKLLNLNLWNYNEWEERKPKIRRFLEKEEPDIVILQEVRDDRKLNVKGDNQAVQLNEMENFTGWSDRYPVGYPIPLYPHSLFYPVTDKRDERPEKYKHPCFEGIAVLSKLPIVNAEMIRLEKQPNDRYYCGNLHFATYDPECKRETDFIAVHFSPNDLFSLLHLDETLRYVEDEGIKPIIAGDFNIKHPKWLHERTKGFIGSYDFKKYISYPKENITLDYILIPPKCHFKSLECIGGLSDHNALLADIQTAK